jgi:hypothetical protein
MKLADLRPRLLGNWTGTNLLRLSWLPEPEFRSPSRLTLASAAGGKFLTLAYTWEHEGKAQEGFLLFGNENKEGEATGAWVDSWHQGGRILQLKGQVEETGNVILLGSYPAPPGPDWGWRITLSAPESGPLSLIMHNLPHDGEEDLAVRAEYNRAPA